MADRFPKFKEDVEVISKLGDTPGTDDGLSSNQLKAKFDQAPKAIKDYLVKLVDSLEELFADSGGAVSGGNLTGGLNMNRYPLTGLKSPEDPLDAVNKSFLDSVVQGINASISEAKAETATKEDKKLLFHGVSVQASSWGADNTYADYPYRASVTLNGVTASMIPHVVFPVDAMSNTGLASVAECYDGGIYIYSDGIPSAAITIPTIICWKGGNAE